jgi:hypothetical protein
MPEPVRVLASPRRARTHANSTTVGSTHFQSEEAADGLPAAGVSEGGHMAVDRAPLVRELPKRVHTRPVVRVTGCCSVYL